MMKYVLFGTIVTIGGALALIAVMGLFMGAIVGGYALDGYLRPIIGWGSGIVILIVAGIGVGGLLGIFMYCVSKGDKTDGK